MELISKLEGEINMFKRKSKKKIRQSSSKKLLCVSSSDNYYDATDDTSLPSFGAMVCWFCCGRNFDFVEKDF